jgi:hypothetical protein
MDIIETYYKSKKIRTKLYFKVVMASKESADASGSMSGHSSNSDKTHLD